MAALTADTQREHTVHTPQVIPLAVNAAAFVKVHGLVSTNAAGRAIPATDTAGTVVQGICVEGLDNTLGANGVLVGGTGAGSARICQVDRSGEWEFDVAGTTPLPGQSALVVNDNTVSADATANNIRAGRFTRPGQSSTMWYVDVEH